jgi:hypothetical protein
VASPWSGLADELVLDLREARENRGDLDVPAALGMGPRSSPDGEQAPSFDAAVNDLAADVRLRAVEASSGVKYDPVALSDTASPTGGDPEPPPVEPIPDEDAVDWSSPHIEELAAEHLPDPEPDDDDELSLADRADLLSEYGDWFTEDEAAELSAPLTAARTAAETEAAVAAGIASHHQQMVYLSDPVNAAKFEAELAARGYDLDQLKRLAEAHDWDWGKALDSLGDIGPVAAGLDGALDNTLAEARHVRGAR